MRIALPIENKIMNTSVYSSFGRAPYYILIDLENDNFTFIDNNIAIESQGGAGIKAAQKLADNGVNSVITFKCGQNAAKTLKEADINIFMAQEGTIEENIIKFKKGELVLLSDIHKGFHQ